VEQLFAVDISSLHRGVLPEKSVLTSLSNPFKFNPLQSFKVIPQVPEPDPHGVRQIEVRSAPSLVCRLMCM